MYYLLNDLSVIACAHGGRVVGKSEPDVRICGRPVLMGAVQFRIDGCPKPPPVGPCMMPQVLAGASARVSIRGRPVMTDRATFMPALPAGGQVVIGVSSPGQRRVWIRPDKFAKAV